MTRLVRTREELDEATAAPMATAVVMTMGALHEGHAQLMREARRHLPTDGRVIVTDFVNPMQFGAGEDFDRYPRTLEADVGVCERNGVDIVFAPSVSEVYGGAELGITVDPGPRGAILEGASRPGHFAGVLTVVAKLLHMTRPDIALYGEKDYQQYAVLRSMARDLAMGIEIVPGPLVRDDDGLALSSRNVYLSPEQRVRARSLHRALFHIRDMADPSAEARIAAGRAHIDADGIDYLTIVDPETLEPIDRVDRPARALLVARYGSVRLLDNVALQ